MTDTTVTTAAPPATAPTAPPAAAPDVNAQLAALQAQLADIQAKANAPGVVKTAGIFAWTKTKCGARLVADFYAFMKGARTILFFSLSCRARVGERVGSHRLDPICGKASAGRGTHRHCRGHRALQLGRHRLAAHFQDAGFRALGGNKVRGGASDSAVDEPQG
jgi:hypothetical protein